jgi:hypothetical protein
MTCAYSLTFEFETQKPLTVRGEVTGSRLPSCIRRASEAAMLAHPQVNWTSVVVLLERRAGRQRPEPEA